MTIDVKFKFLKNIIIRKLRRRERVPHVRCTRKDSIRIKE